MEPIIKPTILSPSVTKWDPTKKMHACIYNGKENLEYREVPMPVITDQRDAIIKVRAASICGSDLHLYRGELEDKYMKGYIIGHESVGEVYDVGNEVGKFKKGDRVAISPVIACGECKYCLRNQFSSCDVTNQNKEVDKLMGARLGAIMGYSELFGGYNGCQAEYVRVPFADVNLFFIPGSVSDQKALLVSDIACTGYHGLEQAEIKAGDNLVIIGAGPVGLMAIMLAKLRNPAKIIAIHIDNTRLQFIRDKFGVYTINSNDEKNLIEKVKEIMPDGPDKVIVCVGPTYPEGFVQKAEHFLGIGDKSSPKVINSALEIVGKNGIVVLIGAYTGSIDNFNVGALMTKNITLRGGITNVHSYQEKIFKLVETGEFDPSIVITHVFPLSKVQEAYNKFNKHEEGIIKPMLIPDYLT